MLRKYQDVLDQAMEAHRIGLQGNNKAVLRMAADHIPKLCDLVRHILGAHEAEAAPCDDDTQEIPPETSEFGHDNGDDLALD